MDVILALLELHFLCNILLDDEFDLEPQKVRFMFPSFTFPNVMAMPTAGSALVPGSGRAVRASGFPQVSYPYF